MFKFFHDILNKVYENGRNARALSGITNLRLINIVEFVSVILLVFIVEIICVGWKKSSFKKIWEFDKSTRTDIAISFFELFNLFNLFSVIFSFGICYYLVGLIENAGHLHLIGFIKNGTIQFIVVYFLSDLKEYFKHYIFHKLPPLWAIHQFHHSATNMNILTGYRFHFLQSALGMFFDVLPFVLLGVQIQTYFAVKILTQIHTLIIHSNVENSWGFVGKYILVSPGAHRVHHSMEKQHYDKNFGGTFIFWDRLFGTYHPAVKIKEMGIPDNPYNKKNVFYDVWLSVIRFFTSSRKLMQSKPIMGPNPLEVKQ